MASVLPYLEHPFFGVVYITEEGVYWDGSIQINETALPVALLIPSPESATKKNIQTAGRIIKRLPKLIKAGHAAIIREYQENPAGVTWRYVQRQQAAFSVATLHNLFPDLTPPIPPLAFIQALAPCFAGLFPADELTPLIVDYTVSADAAAVLSAEFNHQYEVLRISFAENT